MAYVRKTEDRPKFQAGWLHRRRAALLASGLTERQLSVIYLRDIEGLTLAAIGKKFSLTGAWARKEYETALRKLSHPRRHYLLPKVSPLGVKKTK